jgi:large subunit ribosomal protein L5
MKLHKGDNVIMLSGKDGGKKGKVIKTIPSSSLVIVEGLNLIKRHLRARKQGQKGQIISKERAVNVSSVALICKSCGKKTRVGHKIDGGIIISLNKMPRLLDKYRKDVIPTIMDSFKIENIMAVPKVEKVIIHVGIGRVSKDSVFVEKITRDLSIMSGQKPVFRKARKSIAGFKTREGMNIGLMVTLRGARMYDFIDRLVNVALPRSRDFRGIDPKNFDKGGNLNMGIKEHSIFPEIQYETLKDIFGIEITVVTNMRDREQGIKLLKELGFPIKEKS